MTDGQVEGGPARIPEQGVGGVAATSAFVVPLAKGRPCPMTGVGGMQPVDCVSDARAGQAGRQEVGLPGAVRHCPCLGKAVVFVSCRLPAPGHFYSVSISAKLSPKSHI